MPTDFYDVLGVPADASADELKRAYRSRVREYHPDVNDHPEGDAQFKLIRKANDVLSDPAERKDYDRMGHREYAEKRLDDLPPFSVFPEFEDTAADTSDGTDAGRETSTTASTGETTTARSSTNRSRNRQRNRTGQSSSASTATTGGSTASGSTTSDSTGTHANSTRRNQGSADDDTATAGAETTESSQWGDLSGDAATRTTDESETPAGVRRRRGLRRWYGVALVALLTYLGGVGAYLLANREGALRLAGDLQTAPVATLLGNVPLQSPTAYVVGAVDTVSAGTPDLSLLLLAGTALLPLVVLTAVAQFGRGSAWVYALASLGPAVTLAAYPFVLLPVAVVLLGLVVLPLVSGLGFLVDVGRYLLATR